MDLTHKEKIDSLLEEMKSEGGDPEKVGKYVEYLSKARIKVLKVEEGSNPELETILSMIEKGDPESEIESVIEDYDNFVVTRYREAEKMVEKGREIENQLSDVEKNYADKILELERIDLAGEEDNALMSTQYMWWKFVKWVGEGTTDGIMSLANFSEENKSEEDRNKWSIDRDTYLAGRTPYKNADLAFQIIEHERQMAEKVLEKAEERLEKKGT